MDTEGFIQSVDSLLAHLPGGFWGWTPLSSLLPASLGQQPPEKKAEWLTDRLFFPVLALSEELEQLRGWLHEVILYLLLWCRNEDQTVGNLLHLLELDPEARCLIFDDAKCSGRFPHLATDKNTSRLLPVLVVALVELVPKKRSMKTHRALLSISYPAPAVSDP